MEDASESTEREKQLGFRPQKEISYNKFLPYADRLDEESSHMLLEIKQQLAEAIMLREMKPACGIWASRLGRYIQLYGLKFSKEDHIAFVKLLFECLTIPNLEPYLVHKFGQILYVLLKKVNLLSPEDLELPWRPLYDLCDRFMNSSEVQLGMYRYQPQLENTLDSLIHVAKYYFPISTTQEILDEVRPFLYPINGRNDYDIFEWFLPIGLPPELAHHGYKLWLNEIMETWGVCGNGPEWEPEVLSLVAKLAWANIGLIDWDPYMPVMFQRFISSLSLPVSYKHYHNGKKERKLDSSAIATWIVACLGGGSSCQSHLDTFFKSIETYFHHANFGRWFVKLKDLLWKLPQLFIQRLHRERYKKLTWENKVPEDKKLTEEDIDRFVECLKPVAMLSVYSKLVFADVAVTLQHLATLRPKLICQDLIERFYSTLDSITEPHKLTSVMQCIAGVSKPLVRDASTAAHVLPMLMALLPGVDPNDFRKSIYTLQFVQHFVMLIPLVDCSSGSFELTEQEEIVSATTADCENFVCQFFERVFALVENSSLEVTRLDKNDDKKSKVESMAERALTSVCFSILTQCSSEIFQAALRKLQHFVTSRILETKVAGPLVASLCKAFSKVDSVETMKLLLPQISATILRLSESEDVFREDNLDEELLYNLLLLTELVECNGIMENLPILKSILDRCLHLRSREGSTFTSSLLKRMLISLTSLKPTEYRSCNYPYKDNDPEHVVLRDWGGSYDYKKVKINWCWPEDAHVEAAQFLIDRYVLPALDELKKQASGEILMSRASLLASLRVVEASLGAEALMPLWDEEPLVLLRSSIPVSQMTVELGIRKPLVGSNGRNLRLVLVEAIDQLQTSLLKRCKDETKAFHIIVKIWERLLLNKFRYGVDFETHWKTFHCVKKRLENRLSGRKQVVRSLFIDRVTLQHEARCEKIGFCLTETHKTILLNLFDLSCSQYSEVRMLGQKLLSRGLDFFPYSYTVLIPRIVENLKAESSHEVIKGTLYVILGPDSTPLLTRHNWSMLLEVWPAIIKCPPSEKLSVIRLLDLTKDAVHKTFPTITIDLEIPDRCVDAAKMLWAPKSIKDLPEEQAILQGREALRRSNESNRKLYLTLLDTLADTVDSCNLHWRHHAIALCFIKDLVHPDIPYPPRIVQLLLDSINSESLDIRKIAIRSVVFALKQQKRAHPKVKVDFKDICPELSSVEDPAVPGMRSDNLWLQYDVATVPRSAEEWDKPRFVHQSHFGYFTLPRSNQILLYAPSSKQPKLDRTVDELKPEELPVAKFFSDSACIEKLIGYLSLEEKKGKDKFSGVKYVFFKGLFRNYGDQFLGQFKPHLERLIAEKQESSQRCAAEIIAGIIGGSKHWPYEKVSQLWAPDGHNLTGLIRSALTNLTEETMVDWGVCFATASHNRDPNRHHWLLELLMEEALQMDGHVSSASSLIECGKLYVLQGVANQHEWRIGSLHRRLLEGMIRMNLGHPFESMRLRIASLLSNVFEADLKINENSQTLGPHIADFIEEITPRVQVLHSLVNSQKTEVEMKSETSQASETDLALRLFKIAVMWITHMLTLRNGSALPEYFEFLPLMCLLEGWDQDEELKPICSKGLCTLAQAPFVPKYIDAIYAAIRKVSTCASWSARKTLLEFLQVFFFNNMFIIRTSESCANETTQIVLNALEDERIEVREKAAEVLAGLLHCDFIENSTNLLISFKKKMHKLSRKVRSTENSNKQQMDFNHLRILHAATLGLCAFVNAAPYEVPDHVPDIFLILGNHLNDPQPIPTTIRKTLGDFKRTHHDNWDAHKLKFSEEQLNVFDLLIVPPSYIT